MYMVKKADFNIVKLGLRSIASFTNKYAEVLWSKVIYPFRYGLCDLGLFKTVPVANVLIKFFNKHSL